MPSRSFLEARYSLTAWGFTSTKAKYEAQLLLLSLSSGERRGWKAVADGFIANSFGKCCEQSVTEGFNLI